MGEKVQLSSPSLAFCALAYRWLAECEAQRISVQLSRFLSGTAGLSKSGYFIEGLLDRRGPRYLRVRRCVAHHHQYKRSFIIRAL